MTDHSLMPALFVGHGNPMNAIEDTEFSEGWARMAAKLPAPKAVLCVSAHWYVSRLAVTYMEKPRTIHDFGGFPPALSQVQYPAPGSLSLASHVASMLDGCEKDLEWGLDHGAWAVLRRMYPSADIPIVQLSIDRRKPDEWHYALGKKLAPLRKEGVLVVGSGNIVHNLRAYRWGSPSSEPYDWAERFDSFVTGCLYEDDIQTLVEYKTLGEDADLSIPTPDHYLPLLYVLGMKTREDMIRYPVTGFDGGSMSMRCVQVG